MKMERENGMINLKNGMPAKYFRESLNHNFNSLNSKVKKDQEASLKIQEDYNNQLKDQRVLNESQDSQIKALQENIILLEKQVKDLAFMLEINDEIQIRQNIKVEDLQENHYNIKKQIMKPSILKKIWKWITLPDGVSTPKQ